MKHLKRILAFVLFMSATTVGYSQSTGLTITNKSRCEVVIDRVWVADCSSGGQFIYPNLCIPAGSAATIPPVASPAYEWGEVVVCISEKCRACQDFGSCIDQPSSFVSCTSSLPPYTIRGCGCSATVDFTGPNDFTIY